jgi:putative Holliday junction resolvase
LTVPVELYDERLTTRLAERFGGTGSPDSRAAAWLLESWLDANDAESGRPLGPKSAKFEGEGSG